jgi:hypothetical protein
MTFFRLEEKGRPVTHYTVMAVTGLDVADLTNTIYLMASQ